MVRSTTFLFFLLFMSVQHLEGQVLNPDVTFIPSKSKMTTHQTPLGLAPRMIGGRLFTAIQVERQNKEVVWVLKANSNISAGYCGIFKYDLAEIPDSCSSDVAFFPIVAQIGDTLILRVPGDHTRRPPGLYSDHMHIDVTSSNPNTFGHPSDNYVGAPLNVSHPGCLGVTIQYGIYSICEKETIKFDSIPSGILYPQGSNQIIKIKKNIQENLNVNLINVITQDTLDNVANNVAFDSSAYQLNLGTCPANWSVDDALSPGIYQFEAWSPLRSSYKNTRSTVHDTTYRVSGVSFPFMVGKCVTFTDTSQCRQLRVSDEARLAVNALCFEHLIDSVQSCEHNRETPINQGDWAHLLWRAATINNPSPHYVAYDFPTPVINLQPRANFPDSLKSVKALLYLDFKDGISPFNMDDFYFRGDSSMLRGYLMKTLLETWNIKPDWTTTQTPFSDVPATHQYYGWIKKAKSLNLFHDITGTNALFYPDSTCTKEQAYVWLFRVLASFKTTDRLLRPNPTPADFFTPGNYTPETIGLGAGLENGDISMDGDEPFVITGGGLPVNFSFSYNNLFNQLPSICWKGGQGIHTYNFESLGKGWEHNYLSRIIEVTKPGGGAIYAVCWAGGGVELWDPSLGINGEYITKGVYDKMSLSSNGDTVYIKTKAQDEYKFFKGNPNRSYFTLKEIKDRYSNKLFIAWQGSKTISVSEDANGYTPKDYVLMFRYDSGTGKLKSVKDSLLNREVKFSVVNDTLSTYLTTTRNEYKFNYVVRNLSSNLSTESTGRSHLFLKAVKYPLQNQTSIGWKNGKVKLISKGSILTRYEFRPSYTRTGRHTEIMSDNLLEDPTIERFDSLGRLTDSRGSRHHTHSLSYDTGLNCMLPLGSTTNGITSIFRYDPLNGNVLMSKDSSGQLVYKDEYTYNNFNDVLTHKNRRGNTTNYILDPSTGRLQGIRTPLGYRDWIVKNNSGQTLETESPSRIKTKREYDQTTGHLIKVEMSGVPGIITRYTSDRIGRPISVRDALGKLASMTSTDDDLVSDLTNATGKTHTFNYDSNSNLTGNTNATRRETESNTYNQDDDLPNCQSFGSNQICVNYRSDGSVRNVTKMGQTRSFVYTRGTNLLESSPDLAYEYTQDGRFNLSAAENTRFNIRLEFSYDSMDRMVEVVEKRGGVVKNRIGYEYNEIDGVTRMLYDGLGGSKWVEYVYDIDDRVTDVKDWMLGATTPRASYHYHDDGRVDYVDHANGTKEVHFYDRAGRWLGLEHRPPPGLYTNGLTQYNTIAHHRADLDLTGRHTREGYGIPGWTAAQPQIPQEPATYGPSPYNQMQQYSANGVTYNMRYDGANNCTQIGNFTFDYTFNNQLWRISRNGQVVGTSEYDALGNRRTKMLNGNTVDFAYDVSGSGNVLYTTDGGTQPVYYIHGPTGLIAMCQGTNAYYFHGDMRGSTIAITNQDGYISHGFAYDAWGKVIHEKVAPNAANVPFIRHLYNGIHGVEREGIADLCIMDARYYHIPTGRFMSEDMVWGDNPFAFTGNDPINSIDADGEFVNMIFGAAVGITAGYITAKLTGQKYTWKDAVFDGALGALTSGGSVITGMATKQVAKTFIKEVGKTVAEDYIQNKTGLNVNLSKKAASSSVRNMMPSPSSSKAMASQASNYVPSGAKTKEYTKSNLSLGQQKHKAYMAEQHNGNNKIKEFRLPSGKRIDFLDIENGIVHELKPYNPRSIKAGNRQLNGYIEELKTMPRFKGISWKPKLDTY